MDIEFVRSRFIKHFDGTTGSIYASPGRINLIGEHTDYNNGFVFPGAVDKGMIAELKPNGTDKVKAYSIDLKDYVEFGLNEEDAPRTSWARYIFGVCREMIKRGVEVKGFNTAFAGDVPLGAGMSSSAAWRRPTAPSICMLPADSAAEYRAMTRPTPRLTGSTTEACGRGCKVVVHGHTRNSARATAQSDIRRQQAIPMRRTCSTDMRRRLSAWRLRWHSRWLLS